MYKRILHLLTSPHLGGAEWMCLHLAREQQKNGREILIHLFEDGLTADTARRLGLNVSCANLHRDQSGRQRRQIAGESLLSVVKTFGPQVVHSHVPFTHFVCHRFLQRANVPWLATVHGSWRQFGYAPETVARPYLRPYLWLRYLSGLIFCLKSADCVVTVSDSVTRDLALAGFRHQNILRIHNGLPNRKPSLSSSDARTRLNLPPKGQIIGSLGHMAPVKGFDVLIQSFARLAPNFPNTTLVIAGGDVLGDSHYRHVLEELVKRLRIEAQMIILQSVDPWDGFLASLDIFVLASRSEGLPLALIEAMQHSLPSVISSAGGSKEAARHDREGLVFSSVKVTALADNLERLATEKDLRVRLGTAAAVRAKDYLSISRCAGEYEKAYELLFVT